jgi:hypothetical protein
MTIRDYVRFRAYEDLIRGICSPVGLILVSPLLLVGVLLFFFTPFLFLIAIGVVGYELYKKSSKRQVLKGASYQRLLTTKIIPRLQLGTKRGRRVTWTRSKV